MARQLVLVAFVIAVIAMMLHAPIVGRQLKTAGTRAAGVGFGWVGAKLFALGKWAIKLPFKKLWRLIQLLVGLISYEIKKWIGIFVAGGLLAGLTWLTIQFMQWFPVFVLIVVLMDLIWVAATLKAVSRTMHNNLRKQRDRETMEALRRMSQTLPGQVATAASNAKNATVEGFSNYRETEYSPEDQELRRQMKEWEAAQQDHFDPNLPPPTRENIIPRPRTPGWMKGAGRNIKKGWQK